MLGGEPVQPGEGFAEVLYHVEEHVDLNVLAVADLRELVEVRVEHGVGDLLPGLADVVAVEVAQAEGPAARELPSLALEA